MTERIDISYSYYKIRKGERKVIEKTKSPSAECQKTWDGLVAQRFYEEITFLPIE